ncbi:MAG: hypothetical protein J6Y28_00540 [Acholeplasmatales bacterium]|nr:hypothetical protein [Acholeplasmatales bacterium]
MEERKTDKQKIRDDLVAIRAGLSYINDLNEEKEAIERDISSRERKIEGLEEDISNLEKEYKEMEKEVDDLIKRQTTYVGRKRNVERDYNNYKNKDVPKESKLFIISFSIVCIIIALTVILYAIVQYSLLGAMFKYIFLGIVILIAIIFFFIELHGHKVKNKMLESNYNKELSYLQKDLRDAETDVNRVHKRIEELKENLPNQEEIKDEKVQEIEFEITNVEDEISELEEEAKLKVKIATETYNALVANYGETLHTSDWKNLDRLLYYISTNRADSIKEALNALDMKINNEMLIAEIRSNTNLIVGEMNRANSIMFQTITRCAEEINDSIGYMGRKISSSIEASTKKLAKRLDDSMSITLNAQAQVVESNNRLISAQDLTNSLIKNGNKTSEELLEKYKLMSGYYNSHW